MIEYMGEDRGGNALKRKKTKSKTRDKLKTTYEFIGVTTFYTHGNEWIWRFFGALKFKCYEIFCENWTITRRHWTYWQFEYIMCWVRLNDKTNNADLVSESKQQIAGHFEKYSSHSVNFTRTHTHIQNWRCNFF